MCPVTVARVASVLYLRCYGYEVECTAKRVDPGKAGAD